MQQCPTEPCLFRYNSPTSTCFLLLYVDDSLIAGDKEAVDFITKQLQQRYECHFHVPNDFLGLDISQSDDRTKVTVSMHSFTKKIIDKFRIPLGDVPIRTPGRTDLKISRDAPKPETADEEYRNKVGSLSWLTLGLRYDLAYSIKELSRVLDQPTITSQATLLPRALQHTSQTTHYRLLYDGELMNQYSPPPTRKKPTDTLNPYADMAAANLDDPVPMPDDKQLPMRYTYQGQQLQITIQADTDLGGVQETRQSTSGYIVYLGGAIVHWKSATEKLVVTSTMAGEYVALSRADAAGKFVQTIMEFYGQRNTPYNLYTDSQAAEYLATQPNFTPASRSIDLRFHAVKQSYLEGQCRIGGIKSRDNVADILTKSLQPPLHEKHCLHLHPSRKAALTFGGDALKHSAISMCPTKITHRSSTPASEDVQTKSDHGPSASTTASITTTRPLLVSSSTQTHSSPPSPTYRTTHTLHVDDPGPREDDLTTSMSNENNQYRDSDDSDEIALTILLNNPPDYGEGACERRDRMEEITRQIEARLAERNRRRALPPQLNSPPPSSTFPAGPHFPSTQQPHPHPLGWGNQTYFTDDLPLPTPPYGWEHQETRPPSPHPTPWPPPPWGPTPPPHTASPTPNTHITAETYPPCHR